MGGWHYLKHAIDDAHMEVHMLIEAGAEAVDKGYRVNVQRRLVCLCHTGAVGLQSLRDDPQKYPQHHVEQLPIPLHEVPQPLRHRQHPLTHRQAGEYVDTWTTPLCKKWWRKARA